MSAEHKDMLLAEARLSSPPSEQFLRHYHVPSLAREKRQLQNYMAVDLAHTVMLVEEGILARDHGAAILKTLLEIRAMPPEDFQIDPIKLIPESSRQFPAVL